MAWNDNTVNTAERVALYELVDAPRRTGALRVQVPMLLPWSRVNVDGTNYIETNCGRSANDGGGSHALPSWARLVGVNYIERSKGVRSAEVGSPDRPLHLFGWI